MSRQEPQVVGETIERQERAMREALRIAGCERNTTDGKPYSPEESAAAHPTPQEMLNWAGGDMIHTPCLQGAEPLDFGAPAPDGRGNAAFGVDAIVGR